MFDLIRMFDFKTISLLGKRFVGSAVEIQSLISLS